MSSLYLLPHNLLLLYLLILCTGLLLQGYCVAYGWFRCGYQRENLWSGAADLGILVHLGLLILYCAEASYHMRDGFMVVNTYRWFRVMLFVFLSLLCLGQAVAEERVSSLWTIPIAAVTLPVFEETADKYFPILLGVIGVLWIVRAVWYLRIYSQERRESLSAFSVKEAVDTMHFGILLCRGHGESQGQILLANKKMQELMITLVGKLPYSGKEFYECLSYSKELGTAVRKTEQPNLVYILQDGSAWRFDLEFIVIKDMEYALLTASDISRYAWTMDQLRAQNRELEVRNLELKKMLQNMESICRTEEMLQAKGRVHDILGQQISLILRSVREHREPEEALLRIFENGLPKELKNAAGDYASSLKLVAESFQSLGVSVNLKGEFPKDGELQKAFFEIAMEAMTNAVRHGYANEIYVECEHSNGRWQMIIYDNGTVKDLPISEGGGLKNMRRKTEELGGVFSYCTDPHFTIEVIIPEGINP